MLAKEAAILLGIQPRTLCDYEAAGVILPRRDAYGRRVYTEADLAVVRAHMATRKMHRVKNDESAEA